MPKIPKIKPTRFPSQKWMMVERRNPYGKELVYPPITARRPDWYGREMYINERPYPGADYMNEEHWLPIQGPELPADIEEYRRLFDRGNPWVPNRADMSAEEQRIARERYFDAIRADLSRQAYNRERMDQAVEMRKQELWRKYMEEEDPAPGIGWPIGKAERLDEWFENQANWDVRGMKNPNEYPDPPDWDFREYYKDAPWRMW